MHRYLVSVLDGIQQREYPDEAATRYLEDATYRLLMISWLLGMVHVQDAAGAEMADFDPEPLPMDEAVEQMRSRVQMPASDFYQLDAAVRFRAFTVAKLSGMDAISRVKDKIGQVLEEGETLQGFIESGRQDDLLQRAGFSRSDPWYWETVYRTNAISAWNAGRWSQMRRIQDSVQYVEFVAIVDPRTTEFCRAYDGTTRPMNDPIWGTITPPNHFNCRSTTRPVMKGSREAERLSPSSDKAVEQLPPPQDGFDASPLSPEGFADIPDSMWERAREYGIEEDIYQAADRAGVKLRPESPGDAAPAAALPLNVSNRQDMADVIKERLGPITRHGIKEVTVKNGNYFMATNAAGRIYISSKAKYVRDGSRFTASKELLNAFKNLGRRDLTFKQEYALESLWHEVNHNRQLARTALKKNDVRAVVMETTNQWVSRRTYPEMLDRLGGHKPQWLDEVKKSGYGYPTYVDRFDRMLSRAGLRESDILEEAKRVQLEEDWAEYTEKLSDVIAEKSGKDASLVRRVLKNINNEKMFEKALQDLG